MASARGVSVQVRRGRCTGVRARATWAHVCSSSSTPPSLAGMSEDGLDEELIALVGENKSSSPPHASPTERGSSSGGNAGRRAALLDDSSDDEDEPQNPYPLDGIYKDEDDREWCACACAC